MADEEELVGVKLLVTDLIQQARYYDKGSIGIVDGMKTYAVFSEDGELAPVYSISASIDYPGI